MSWPGPDLAVRVLVTAGVAAGGCIGLALAGRAGADVLVVALAALAFFALFSAQAVHRELGRLRAEADVTDARLRRYRLTSAGADSGLWHWEVPTGSVYLSARGEAFLGVAPAEPHDASAWLDHVHPADIGRVRMELDDFVLGRISSLDARFRTIDEEGAPARWLLITGVVTRDGAGNALAVGGSISDVTAAKQHEEELLREAFHDALTGLPNRALFLDRIAHACARSQRRPELLFGVMFLDIDAFKIVNDSLGHAVGDSLLVGLAKRLESCLRPADTLARLGGDEFTVLVEDVVSVAQMEQVAQRLLDSLKEPFQVGGQELVMTASIGIASSALGYVNPGDLLRDADTAMYRAKADGKARHCFFAAEMREGVVARMNLERDLYGAIEREEFELHYQPIVDVQSGRIQGFEALVRWRRADGSLVQPQEFVPLAEETGQIIPISFWVFERACLTMQRWRETIPGAEALWVNVNVSSRHLAQAGLAARLVELLHRYSLPPAALRLEITETVMLSPGASQSLTSLREAGIELHLDDFGTGYSSLSYLHKYPINGLKIDRAFITTLDERQRPGIVYSIIQLAANLSMTVTAEGVETLGQLECLRRYGCGRAQGFYFSRPVPADEIVNLLLARLPPVAATPGSLGAMP